MQVLKHSFEEEFAHLADEIQREHYTEEKQEMESYAFMFESKLTDIVDIKDELANVEIGTMLKTTIGKLELSGQTIEFVSKNGKTLKPMLGKHEVTGNLKKKFLASVGAGVNDEEVEMWGKYFTKTTFQYGSLAIAYYMSDWQMNKGFFMRVKTAKINRTQRKRVYDGERFAHTNEEIEILTAENEDLRSEVEELKERLELLDQLL